MTTIENLLVQLVEECCETGQRATKALRFGLQEVQTGQSLTNAERLVYEFNDIVAIMALLFEQGVIDDIIDDEAIGIKKEKVVQYLTYSRQLGAVTDNPVGALDFSDLMVSMAVEESEGPLWANEPVRSE